MARLVAITPLRLRRDFRYRLVLRTVLLAHLRQRSILCNWGWLHLFISAPHRCLGPTATWTTSALDPFDTVGISTALDGAGWDRLSVHLGISVVARTTSRRGLYPG